MNIRLIAISALTCCLSWTSLMGQSDPADAKAKLSKWVQTRQLISKEATDWELDEEFLTSTKELLQSQKEDLEKKVSELEAETTDADKKREALVDERTELQLASVALAQQIAQLETDIKQLIKIFPQPLQNKLEPLIRQIPENPDETDLPLGKRLTHVLGILGQAEKFNGTANVYGEAREIGGKEVMVNTIYWGLSYAIYVDTNGKIAGYGVPTDDGWEWTEDNSIATEAKQFIDMYEGNTDVIEFVQLPVNIQ